MNKRRLGTYLMAAVGASALALAVLAGTSPASDPHSTAPHHPGVHPGIQHHSAAEQQRIRHQQAAEQQHHAALSKLTSDRAKDRTARHMTATHAKTPHRTPDGAPSGKLAALGKDLFFDTRLSNPAGMACATCHDPAAAFTFPDSKINEAFGVAPGIVPGRFGNRKVPTITYNAYTPPGPTYSDTFGTYVGGFFWDGRAHDLASQVPFPLLNPNEMNNVVHNVASPALVVKHVSQAPYAGLFRQIYGKNVFSLPATQVVQLIGLAIQAYEETPEVSPFTSKYDAYLLGRAKLSDSEMNGLQLVTGSTTGRPGGPASKKNAQCAACHGIPSDPTTGPDLWSFYCYVNIGVPKNPNNPYYKMTNTKSNPLGYNPLGADYVDLGLGDFAYPLVNLPPGNIGPTGNGQGDFLAVNGTFKAPTLRNVDKRPRPDFVKAYMHNGAFKSLPEVVHFYNTRNLTTRPGEVIDFTQPNPYAGLKGRPLWPPPEFPSTVTLQNPTGAPGSLAAQVGNLGLTVQEEADIVAFLGALTDGYFER